MPRKVENPELKRILRDYFRIRSEKVKVEESITVYRRCLLSGSGMNEYKTRKRVPYVPNCIYWPLGDPPGKRSLLDL